MTHATQHTGLLRSAEAGWRPFAACRRTVHRRGRPGSPTWISSACDRPGIANRQERAQVSQGEVFLRLERRDMLAGLLATFLLGDSSRASAEPSLETYRDPNDSFEIGVPEGWMSGSGGAAGGQGYSGASGTRRALAWFPEHTTDTNLTVLITNVGADYTSLGSFGNAEQFGTSLVASMDRSFLLRSPFGPKPAAVQVAKLIDAKERSKMYYIEYTVKKPGEEQNRHFLSVVALGFNGRYNRLYTVTGQCLEGELPRYGGALQQAMQSFRPPAPVI